MANIKISQLAAAASTVGTQEFEVNESGTSKKVTGTQIKAFVKDGLVISDLSGVTTTTAELNKLTGLTTTTTELNKLTGTPAGLTATELGYVDGVTDFIQTQLDAKAARASPALTGTPTAPTATALTNTTQIATTAFVLASSAPLASPAFTGTPTAPTASVATNTTQLATTAFVLANKGGMTLLGTLTTTSGTSHSLTNIAAGYRKLYIEFDGVSGTSTGITTNVSLSSTNGAAYGTIHPLTSSTVVAANTLDGWIEIGNISSTIANAKTVIKSLQNGGTILAIAAGLVPTNTAAVVDAIQFSITANAFDAGSIRIYGVK